MVLGLGTGSTTRLAVDEIGKLVKSGYKLVGIPTSVETEKQARSLGIPLTTLDQVEHIDLTIDGADEVDPHFRLIKGLGGALLREKIVAYHSKREIIIVDDSKMVEILGVQDPPAGGGRAVQPPADQAGARSAGMRSDAPGRSEPVHHRQRQRHLRLQVQIDRRAGEARVRAQLHPGGRGERPVSRAGDLCGRGDGQRVR